MGIVGALTSVGGFVFVVQIVATGHEPGRSNFTQFFFFFDCMIRIVIIASVWQLIKRIKV